MPNIIDTTYFVNDLFIPNAKEVAGGANNNAYVLECITRVEKSLLRNALGLSIYNELQAALPVVEGSEDKWKWLVNGREYDGKVWEGLSDQKSLIAYLVYAVFLDENSHFWTTTGTVKPAPENSENVTPAFKYATSWLRFTEKYQKGCLTEPYVINGYGYEYRDYYGNNEDVEVSLYQYLRDNKELYGWDESNFKVYAEKNTFGL